MNDYCIYSVMLRMSEKHKQIRNDRNSCDEIYARRGLVFAGRKLRLSCPKINSNMASMTNGEGFMRGGDQQESCADSCKNGAQTPANRPKVGVF